MPSLYQIVVASTLLGLGAAAPLQKRAQPFTIQQVANPKHVKNGVAAYVKALSKWGAPAAQIKTILDATSSSVTATPQQYDSEYLAPVTIGDQDFTLDFDTGSSDLWVFGKGVSGRDIVYKPSSSAKKLSGESWSISYGDGSSASGIVYSDTVTIGGTTVTGQAVEAATTASSEFTSGVEDGLLGLAFDSINTVTPDQKVTFLTTAINQGLPGILAADLKAGEPGTYSFGAIDSAYADSLTYTAVDDSQGFWMFTPDSGDAGIADTGTTLILLSQSSTDSYWAQVSAAAYDSSQGGYTFPCSTSLPDFSITIGGYTATVPGSYINYAPADGTNCFGGIQAIDQDFSIYGDVFLKSQYVVFDRTQDTPRLGFAPKQ